MGSTPSNPFTDENYLQVLHLLGRFDDALRVAEQARERHPHFVRHFYFDFEALAVLGRIAEMEARIAEARNSIGPGYAANIYRDMADELARHGHNAAARQFALQAVQGFDRLSTVDKGTPFYRVSRAGALRHLERWEEIHAILAGIPVDEAVWEVGDELSANQGQILALQGIAAAKGGDDNCAGSLACHFPAAG